MYFYLIVALQGFCIYHLYKNRNQTYWYFVIVFIPVIGSIVYLITQVFNKRDVHIIQNEITTIVNPTKKVKDLEKRLEFSDTFQNRVNLADALFEITDYDTAIKHYEQALSEYSDEDYHVYKMLIEANSKIEAYEEVAELAEKIRQMPDFKNSKTQFLYGLALDKMGKPDEAEKEMKQIDQRYSNYDERVILAKFLIHRNKVEEAREILKEICNECEHMNRHNRKKYKLAVVEADRLRNELYVSS